MRLAGRDKRECGLCGLGSVPGNHGPVWMEEGLLDARPRIMVIGEAPGKDEDTAGSPFVGKAGRELRERLLPLCAGIDPATVFITNVVKCRPPNNRTPTESECAVCTAAYLDAEITEVAPDYIIACGATATQWLLSRRMNMESCHGIGYVALGEDDRERIVIPVYHPAAGFRSGKIAQQCVEDFMAVRRVIGGGGRVGVGSVWDQWEGLEEYWEYTPEDEEDLDYNTVALDTETYGDGRPFSVQLSVAPGMGILVRADDDRGLRAVRGYVGREGVLTLLHNATFDLRVLADMGVYPKRYHDTMVMAYLLGNQPQGLKPLAYRLCGMDMDDYSDLVAPYAGETLWRWIAGLDTAGLDKKVRKRIDRICTDYAKGKPVDMEDRWKKIDGDIEGGLTEVFGALPVPGIDVVPWDKALRYACRDADATFRVYPILLGMLAAYGDMDGDGGAA